MTSCSGKHLYVFYCTMKNCQVGRTAIYSMSFTIEWTIWHYLVKFNLNWPLDIFWCIDDYWHGTTRLPVQIIFWLKSILKASSIVGNNHAHRVKPTSLIVFCKRFILQYKAGGFIWDLTITRGFVVHHNNIIRNVNIVCTSSSSFTDCT